MQYTKTLQKAINEYGLNLIHKGRSGYEGSRYLDHQLSVGWPEADQCGQYVFEFLYFDQRTTEWLVFEKICSSQSEARAIKEKEFKRRIWDSRQLYFEDKAGRRHLLIVS